MIDRDEFNTHIVYEGHTEVGSLRTFSGHLKIHRENIEHRRMIEERLKDGGV